MAIFVHGLVLINVLSMIVHSIDNNIVPPPPLV